MSFWEYLWPFGERRRERKAIEDAFERELRVLKKRGVSLQTVVSQLKGEPVEPRRAQLVSFPSSQETS